MEKNKIIHITIMLFFMIIIFGVTGFIIFKYQVEGETNPVFDISKVLIVSTAEGQSKAESTARWDCSVNQNNDLYITIEKSKKKQDMIKSVTINNVRIIENPQIGTIEYYRPAETGLFKCDDKYKIEGELVYTGSKSGSLNNLEISNQGGTVLLRICNKNVSEYVSNDSEQILHDGTLLKNSNVTIDQLKAKLSLDVIIETESNIKYISTIEIDIPVGNIIDEGTVTQEIEADKIVIKRM